VGADAIENGGEADRGKRRADRHQAAGDGGVALAEFQRVEAEALAERVHRLLHGEGGLDAAGRAIGLRARLVGDDVEALQVEVGALVERGRSLHDEGGPEARQAARVEVVGGLDGGEAAVAVGADGDVDQRGGRRTGAALQHLLARQHDLHRPAALLRQASGDGLTVDDDLAAERAADFQRHDLELRQRQAEHAADHQLGGELPLGGGPHRDEAVGIDVGHGDLRLEIALVGGVDGDADRGGERSAGESPGRIAAGDDGARADVARRARTRLHALGDDVVMQDGSIRRHGGGEIDDGGQRLVVDLDQGEGSFGNVQIGGGNRSDRLADPEHFAARHVDLRDHPHVVAGLAHRDRGAERHLGKIGGGDDGQHTLQGFGARGIDAADAGMRVRAAQHLRMHQAGELEVGRVDRAASHALAGIDAREAFADRFEGALGLHQAIPLVPAGPRR